MANYREQILHDEKQFGKMFVQRVKTTKDKAEIAYEKAKEVSATAKKGYKTVKKLFDKTE